MHCALPLSFPIFHIYYAFEPKFPTRTSLAHMFTPPRPNQYSNLILHSLVWIQQLLLYIYYAFQFSHQFAPQYNSTCLNTTMTSSIQQFDPIPLSMYITTSLVYVTHALPLLRPLFHIYYTFELSFPTRTSIFKYNSTCLHPIWNITIQQLDPTPFCTSIATYFVNIVCIVLIIQL